jgi:hypothetical protein
MWVRMSRAPACLTRTIASGDLLVLETLACNRPGIE